jgi:prepilin-type N-terminal cleavage/methylation domain-containing protein
MSKRGLFSSLKNSRGFTLVELMTSVGIVGILSTVAIPQFSEYTRNAKRSEAKANLGAIFTSQTVFRNEWEVYSPSFDYIGFVPDTGNGLYFSYAINEARAPLPALVTGGNSDCQMICGYLNWACNVYYQNACRAESLHGTDSQFTSFSDRDTFAVEAHVHWTELEPETWTIDQSRKLTRLTVAN